MYFQNILGNEKLKKILLKEINNDKVPHAQLFNGARGAGQLPMALAFVMYLFCENRKEDDSCGNCANCTKMLKLIHPDLHFFYPTKGSKSNSKEHFLDFQTMIIQNPYMDKEDWYQNNKISTRGEIKVGDAKIINKIINLQAYAGTYKVFILWLPETMNQFASNKLLKHIEEPNSNTLFILISENSNLLLPTIVSRLQIKTFEKINESLLVNDIKRLFPDIEMKLIKKYIYQNQNNYNLIVKKLDGRIHQEETHNNFIDWIRLCFLSKHKKSIPDLINWCEDMGQSEKVFQLQFLKESSQIFRHAFLLNYNPPFSLSPEIDHPNFNFNNFSNHLSNNNIYKICALLDSSHDYLNRYANSKILFLDLSFSLGKLLHKES